MPSSILTLYEEESYQEKDLLDRLSNTVPNGSPVPETSPAQKAKDVLDELLEVCVRPTDPNSGDDGAGTDSEEDDDADWAEPGAPLPLFQRRSTRDLGIVLKVRAIVGSGRLPKSGLLFEVLPKVKDGDGALKAARHSLVRMWSYAFDLSPYQQDASAGLLDAEMPLHEWLIRRFIDQVQRLLRQGIRLQYVEREENLLTVRGRLLPLENIRRNAFAPHRFYCRFEELSPDRPENRLIRSALGVVANRSSNARNRRAALQLLERLHEVPPSRNVRNDLASWRNDRLMAHYREIRSTCTWILRQRGIAPAHGGNEMVGCFARMPMVFERYAARWLAEKLKEQRPNNLEVLDQTRTDPRLTKHLLRWVPGGSANLMMPDILVYRTEEGANAKCVAVLDAKWKRRRPDDPIAREDAYQMYAYASHWLKPAGGSLALIYPYSGGYQEKSRKFKLEGADNVVGYPLPFKIPEYLENDKKFKEGCDLDWLTQPRTA